MNEPKPLYQLEQIESIETELTILNAKRSLTATPRQLEVHHVGDCILLRDRTDPASPYYNRVKRFGSESVDLLEELLQAYPEAAPCFDIAPHRMNERAAGALIGKGYLPIEQLTFMAARPRSRGAEAETLDIELVTGSNAEAFIEWIRLSSGGHAYGQALIDRVKSFFHRPDFLNFMLAIGGEPAAMGSLFLSGRAGYVANDYTFPAFRGRGCQTALLKHRLSIACERGLEAVYTDVEFGTVSHSNMERVGFRTVFMNTFWMKNSPAS